MGTALAPLLTPDTVMTADAGDYREDHLTERDARAIDAWSTDGRMRKRDDRFATQDRHQTAPDPLHDPLHDQTPTAATPPALVTPSDVTYAAEARIWVCPAGPSRYRKGKPRATTGHIADRLQGATGVCGPCALRAPC